MARPIKDTPILCGEDAKRFEQRMDQVNSGKVRETKDTYDRALKSFNRIRVVS